jgi:hypothetical protein
MINVPGDSLYGPMLESQYSSLVEMYTIGVIIVAVSASYDEQ